MEFPVWTKPALVGAGAGAVALAIVGFSWGGWVTGGNARNIAQEASEDAREQLVATICVESFVTNTNAAENLTALKEANSYEQDNFIEDGGWIMIPGIDDDVTGAADICADRLVALEGLPERAAVPEAAEEDADPTKG